MSEVRAVPLPGGPVPTRRPRRSRMLRTVEARPGQQVQRGELQHRHPAQLVERPRVLAQPADKRDVGHVGEGEPEVGGAALQRRGRCAPTPGSPGRLTVMRRQHPPVAGGQPLAQGMEGRARDAAGQRDRPPARSPGAAAGAVPQPLAASAAAMSTAGPGHASRLAWRRCPQLMDDARSMRFGTNCDNRRLSATYSLRLLIGAAQSNARPRVETSRKVPCPCLPAFGSRW